MRYTQFINDANESSSVIADSIIPDHKRISYSKVRELVRTAYYSGCLNTYDYIKSNPIVLKPSIGFIK